MCSNDEPGLRDVCRAIDEVSERARAEPDEAADGRAETRLAGIWGMLAELDPLLASRLPGYAGDADR